LALTKEKNFGGDNGMIPWINFGILITSSVVFTIFYVKSVRPAALERRIGSSAYKKCTIYRLVASCSMLIAAINYILYFWFPLPINLPAVFPWPWWVSALIALCIAVPSLFLMIKGAKDAGAETMTPKREHEMYGGIYEKIRHPQAVGEFPLWWVIAFLVNSPFLIMFSFVYLPIWYYFCIAEENDLNIRYGKAYEEYCKKVGFWIPRRN
jgi:methanethiol S-methyltransferase